MNHPPLLEPAVLKSVDCLTGTEGSNRSPSASPIETFFIAARLFARAAPGRGTKSSAPCSSAGESCSAVPCAAEEKLSGWRIQQAVKNVEVLAGCQFRGSRLPVARLCRPVIRRLG